MSELILKKLGHQELGYKNATSLNPGESRGQYFLISKNHLDFFPPLKKEIPQDLQILNIVSHGSSLPFQAKYIYDNDKYHGSKANSPRNEHRINLNLNVNPEREVYLKEDIVVFKKEDFFNEDNEKETAFVLTRYRSTLDPFDYKLLTELLDEKKENSRSKNYASVSPMDLTRLRNHKERVLGRVMSYDPIIPFVDESLLNSKDLNNNTVKQKEDNELRLIEKQIKRILFEKYDYKCIVSGIGYKWEEISGVKTSWRGITGAHIKPRAHDGEYSPKNIIPLLEPIHQLFDRGVFTINDELCIQIHEQALNDPLLSNFHSFNRRKLEVPKGIDLSIEFIRHHQKEVYGSFVTGKQIRSNYTK